MLDKTERINELLDWYASLLTPKQKDIALMHYREDFSLSEIAEHTQSSRAAIHESLKRTQTLLDEYEAKLQCHAKFLKRKELYLRIESLDHQDVNQILQQLLDLE